MSLDLLPRYVRLGPKAVVEHGSLAGTEVPHRFIPDAHTGSSCQACYGSCDTWQHLTLIRRQRGSKKR